MLASTKAEQLLFVFREAKSIVAVNFSERQLQRLLKFVGFFWFFPPAQYDELALGSLEKKTKKEQVETLK